jgi:metabolite-proton symporter
MTATESTPNSSIGKVVLASFIGTAIEWYDFFLYGTASALVFGKLFFPKYDDNAGLLLSFSVYAVGFFARPLGGVVFGHFGDRFGRKSTLVVSLVMMGLATFLMGLLPTYQQVGVWAPILLTLLRFVQGFGVGGEWGGAVLLAVEHGEKGRRGFYSSWVQVGVPVGQLLAAGVFAAVARLPDESLLGWGWRLPFLAGIALLLIGLFIRVRIMESPLFTKALEAEPPKRLPIVEVLQKHPRNVLLAMGARMAENMSFYIITVIALSYATNPTTLNLSKDVLLQGVLLASACQVISLPVYGYLSDRFGRRPVYLFGAIGMGCFAFPFFWLVDTANVYLIWLAMAIGLGLFHAAMYGPQAAFFSELFGTKVRYSGASLGYQLASPLSGGLAPLIATALLQWSNQRPWPVSLYVVVMVAVTVVSVAAATETARSDLQK